MISVVIPVFNNAAQLPKLIPELHMVFSELNIPFEVILVDDASKDTSLDVCKQLARELKFVKSIALSHNVGQHKAIFKGLQKTKGDKVLIMDADGQDSPAVIHELYQNAINDIDAVLVVRQNRKSKLADRISSFLFYFVWSLLGQKKAKAHASNFGLYSKSLIDAILSTNLPPYSMQLIALKLNAPLKYINAEHRESATSAYNLKKRWELAVKIFYLYAYKSLRRLLLIGIVFILVANSILVRFLLKGYANLKWPMVDAFLISIFMLLGAMFLFLFFSCYRVKKHNLQID